jgi:hypothetical protein
VKVRAVARLRTTRRFSLDSDIAFSRQANLIGLQSSEVNKPNFVEVGRTTDRQLISKEKGIFTSLNVGIEVLFGESVPVTVDGINDTDRRF